MRYYLCLLLFVCAVSLVAQSTLITNGIDDALQYDTTLYTVTASRDGSIVYHVIEYTGLTGKKFNSIAITDNSNAIFQYLETKSATEANLNALKKARDRWMTLCNKHDASKLVSEMYDSEAIYYNHKPLVVGHDLLSNEYAYMNNESYMLELNPLYILPVNEDIVFEIGQCKGSYGGKYILVWKLQEKGNYTIVMDSNL